MSDNNYQWNQLYSESSGQHNFATENTHFNDLNDSTPASGVPTPHQNTYDSNAAAPAAANAYQQPAVLDFPPQLQDNMLTGFDEEQYWQQSFNDFAQWPASSDAVPDLVDLDPSADFDFDQYLSQVLANDDNQPATQDNDYPGATSRNASYNNGAMQAALANSTTVSPATLHHQTPPLHQPTPVVSSQELSRSQRQENFLASGWSYSTYGQEAGTDRSRKRQKAAQPDETPSPSVASTSTLQGVGDLTFQDRVQYPPPPGDCTTGPQPYPNDRPSDCVESIEEQGTGSYNSDLIDEGQWCQNCGGTTSLPHNNGCYYHAHDQMSHSWSVTADGNLVQNTPQWWQSDLAHLVPPPATIIDQHHQALNNNQAHIMDQQQQVTATPSTIRPESEHETCVDCGGTFGLPHTTCYYDSSTRTSKYWSAPDGQRNEQKWEEDLLQNYPPPRRLQIDSGMQHYELTTPLANQTVASSSTNTPQLNTPTLTFASLTPSRDPTEKFKCQDCVARGKHTIYQKTESTGDNRCRRCQEKWLKRQRETVPPTYHYDPAYSTLPVAMAKVYADFQPIILKDRKADDWVLHVGREAEWVQRFLQAACADTDVDSVDDARTRQWLRDQQRVFNRAGLEKTGGCWYTPDWVNARFVLLFYAILNLHRGGSRPYALGGNNAGYGKVDETLSCGERLGVVEGILREDKRVVMNVVEGNHVVALAENPGSVRKRKSSNKCTNSKKAAMQTLARGVLEAREREGTEESEGGGGGGGGKRKWGDV